MRIMSLNQSLGPSMLIVEMVPSGVLSGAGMANPAVSFEFFPPGDAEMAQQLWQAVLRLAPLNPNFVSITYGADGSTRTRTHEFVQRVLHETDLRVAPHLTCV